MAERETGVPWVDKLIQAVKEKAVADEREKWKKIVSSYLIQRTHGDAWVNDILNAILAEASGGEEA